MKTYAVLLLVIAFSLGESLAVNFPDLDKSPLDIALFKKGGDAKIKVLYSRPAKNGRVVFGKLVKYGKVWRTGANECTEIRFYQDVKIAGQEVKAGVYSIFTIPNENEWTFILNSDTDKWGAFFYKEENDILRTNMTVESPKKPIESFSMTFDKTKSGVDLYMAWDNVQVHVPIEII